MFRKLILAAAATAALGLTAVSPTTASAHGWHGGHGHWHGGHGHRFGIGFYPAYGGYGGYGGGCFYVKKFVPTPYGVIPKRVLVCS